MVLQKTWNNTVYNIPQSGERGWATLTNFLVALADGAQTTGKQIIGRRTAVATPVTVTSTTDCYVGVNVSLAAAAVNLPVGVNGQVFVIADESNAAGTFNITISPNGANTINGTTSYVMDLDKQVVYLVFNNGNWVVLSTGTSSAPITGVTDSATIDFTLTPGNLTAVVKDDSIENVHINSAAAIEYSKLNLAASIVDADIATTISYVKLNLADSIVDADINSAAAIAYSKLNLTGTIINADISNSAAIVYSKLALTNSIVDADINSAAAISYSKLNLAGNIVNADVNASAAIAYSKLNLSSAIVNADVAPAAAIAYSKLALTGSIADADLSASGTVVLKDATQTLTNKTLAGPVTSNYQQFTNTTVPATPATGSTRIYASSVDKKFHYVDDAGTDTVIGSGAGGGGGKNYLTAYSDFDTDPSTGMVTNLTATGNRASNTTVWGANTTSLLSQTSTALRGTKSAQLVNGSSTSNFIESPMFVLDTIDVNTNQLFISFDMNAPGTSGDWLVQVIRYNSSGTFQENIAPSITQLPSGYYNFKCAFSHSVTATDQYAIRFRSNTATARTLTLDSLVVGPQVVVNSAAVGGWISYIPTVIGVGTVSNLAAFYRRVGDSMEVAATYTIGTPTTVTGAFTLPAGLTIDTAKTPLNGAAGASTPLPVVGTHNTNRANICGPMIVATSSSTSQVYYGNTYTSSSNTPLTNMNALFTAGDVTSINFKVPIAQWTSTVTLAGNANIEYASNSSATNADDATSFVNGAAGSVGVMGVTTLTANRDKTVQFQTPIQPTDRLVLEIQVGGTGPWIPATAVNDGCDVGPFARQSSISYGFGILSSTTTQVKVRFGQYSRAAPISYAGSSTEWSGVVAGTRWRVAKYSAVGLAELAPATATSVGTVSRESRWTAFIPGVGSGFGTATSNVGYYKVIGDSLFVRGSFVAGTTTASLAAIFIPSGFTINTAVIPLQNNTSNPGSIIGTFANANSANLVGPVVVAPATNATTIYFSQVFSNATLLTPANGNAVVLTGNTVSYSFEVPIV